MREYVLVTTTDVAADHLWAVAADTAGWPAWQPRTEPAGAAWAVPTSRGGAWVGLRVVEARPPARLVAVASRFLARVRTTYQFEPSVRGTRIRVTVQLLGPLSFAHRRSFDWHQQQTLSALVERLIQQARNVGAFGRPEEPAEASARPAPPGRLAGLRMWGKRSARPL